MGEHIAPSSQESGSGSHRDGKPRNNAASRPTKKRGKKKGQRADLKQGRHASNKSSNSHLGQRGKDSTNKAVRANSANGLKKPASRSRNGGQNKTNGKSNSSGGQRRPWLGKTAYAALDLGTNNCRLLIARAAQEGFTVIDAFSRVVRLGEGLASSGKMSDEAMDRAVEALGICAQKLKKRNVVLARSVATEACRQAENGREFMERVAKETGIILDIIEPQEEARLAVMGCYALLEKGDGPALIFDIGGGSTELVLVGTDNSGPEILDWVSVPWGVVSLTESVSVDHSSRETRMAGYKKMRANVQESLSEFAARLPMDQGSFRMMGTSGTVTTLSSVYLKLQSYDRSAVDGLHVATADMRGIAQEIAARSLEQRAEYPTIGADRADLVVAGCAILETIFDIWPGERLGVADRGIREGILRALIASDRKGRHSANGR